MKAQDPNLKVEIGAWSQEGGAWQTPREYFEMASNSSKRETFARSVATFVTENNFDGFHLHWGNPESSGIDLDQAKTHLTQVLRGLKTALHLANKTLSVAVWSPLASKMTKSLRLRMFTKKPTSCSSMRSITLAIGSRGQEVLLRCIRARGMRCRTSSTSTWTTAGST